VWPLPFCIKNFLFLFSTVGKLVLSILKILMASNSLWSTSFSKTSKKSDMLDLLKSLALVKKLILDASD
jgi:hypothetical protein